MVIICRVAGWWCPVLARVCLWHILERGLGTTLESLVGQEKAKQAKNLIWNASKARGGDFGPARAKVLALIKAVYVLFDSPVLGPDSAQFTPDKILERVEREAKEAGFEWEEVDEQAAGLVPIMARNTPKRRQRALGAVGRQAAALKRTTKAKARAANANRHLGVIEARLAATGGGGGGSGAVVVVEGAGAEGAVEVVEVVEGKELLVPQRLRV